MRQPIFFRDLGKVEYGATWELQESLMQENVRIKSRKYEVTAMEESDTGETIHHLLFCEHEPVYTLGKSGHIENLLVNDSRMKELNVSFYKTNRGGDITFHGPGQIVCYPILDLELFYTDLGKYMRNLEEVIIRALARYQIKGERLPGSTGVWIDADIKGRARKICAMGVRCSRWVTMHGLAFNINTNLSYFNYIVPCGITDKSVTSLAQELGYMINEEEVKDIMHEEFAIVFDADIISYSSEKRKHIFTKTDLIQ